MTGVKSASFRKSGQAMVEFLLGLVGIMFIVLALELIGSFVVEDFEAMSDARTEAAQAVVNGSTSSTGASRSSFYDDLLYGVVGSGIKYTSVAGLMEAYPSRYTDANGYEEVAEGNPISDLCGGMETIAVPVEAAAYQKVLGKAFVCKTNVMWIPPRVDLLGEEQ